VKSLLLETLRNGALLGRQQGRRRGDAGASRFEEIAPADAGRVVAVFTHRLLLTRFVFGVFFRDGFDFRAASLSGSS